MKDLTLIPYSCGAGAGDKTCEDAPQALYNFGLTDKLQKKSIKAKWTEDLQEDKVSETPDDKIIRHALYLKKQVGLAINSGTLPVTLGGDHSMAMGTWTGVAENLDIRGKLGLIWIDAHLDAHTATTSHTGNRHGMPVSYLLGYGDDVLTEITGKKPVIAPTNLCFIGIRSFEPEEAAFLSKLGVRVFMMAEVRSRGLSDVMKDAIKIASTGTAGFGISLDIDAFDPQIAPGTGTKAPNGLLLEEFQDAARNVLKEYKNNLFALELAEYNPHLDKNNITAGLITEIIAAIAG